VSTNQINLSVLQLPVQIFRYLYDDNFELKQN